MVQETVRSERDAGEAWSRSRGGGTGAGSAAGTTGIGRAVSGERGRGEGVGRFVGASVRWGGFGGHGLLGDWERDWQEVEEGRSGRAGRRRGGESRSSGRDSGEYE